MLRAILAKLAKRFRLRPGGVRVDFRGSEIDAADRFERTLAGR